MNRWKTFVRAWVVACPWLVAPGGALAQPAPPAAPATTSGAKENSTMGWNVVNVEYRPARVAPAPAAVEDCLCALRFIAAPAKTYNLDVTGS